MGQQAEHPDDPGREAGAESRAGAAAKPVQLAGGGLALCPWNLATAPPLGGAFQMQGGVCTDDRGTDPVRLKQR